MSQNLEIFSPKYLVTTCYHSELKITVNVFVSEIFVVNLDNKDFFITEMLLLAQNSIFLLMAYK